MKLGVMRTSYVKGPFGRESTFLLQPNSERTKERTDALAALHPCAREALCARFLVGRSPSVRCSLLHPSIARSCSGIPPRLPLLQSESESSRHDGNPATAAATKLYLTRILSCRPGRQTNTLREGTDATETSLISHLLNTVATLLSNATRGQRMHRK